MIIKNTKKHLDSILEYIGKDYGKCLYLYIDLIKYGFDNPNVSMWTITNSKDQYEAVILKYYTGMHIYSKDNKFDENDVISLIKEQKPSLVCAMKETIDKISSYLPNYEVEVGTVGKLVNIKDVKSDRAYSAPMSEIKEIAEILAEDDALGKPYGFDLLYSQLKERKEEGFGRNFILRDEENNEIIAHAATYAENENVGVISGVFVNPKYRAKGYSKQVLGAICEELLQEGKDVFSYYYIPSATKMHESVGFEKIGDWAKLIKE